MKLKKVTAILLTAVMTAALAACGSSSGDSSGSSGDDAGGSGTYTIGICQQICMHAGGKCILPEIVQP